MRIKDKIRSFFKGHERTVKAKKNIIITSFCNAISVLVSFLFVPLMLNVLSDVEYGAWLTLTSVVSWFTFFDLGLGNGLRNRLTKSIANKQYKRAKMYVSTAYGGISIVVLLLVILFSFIYNILNWNSVFNIPESVADFSKIIAITVYFFLGKFIFQLINSILLANLNSGITSVIISLTNVVNFLGVYLLDIFSEATFLNVTIVMSIIPVFILLLFTIFYFNTTFKKIKPSIHFVNFRLSKDLFNLGFKFFYIQIAVIVLFSTDNFIISKVLGPEEVVPYNISHKYFAVILMFFSIITGPLWSSVTEAYEKSDFIWIKKSIRIMLRFWFLSVFLVLLMMIFSNKFYKIWVGDEVVVPVSLSILMGVYIIMSTFSLIFTNFINGVGAVKLQLYTATISMIINIPLSIYFAKYLEMGSKGVILATCVSLSYSMILKPVQYYKIINKTGTGIWIK
ncbi:oligosaccharide flippase family protein [Tenacibaculum sp. S7007]|uniref:Oligosaccharide flippase family protein n=1 Tax=Tenacibaculum pelagium TaxID=2759527 RepID=A0A839AMH8_9FLAO|nr:MATE family efflux transporter [Tenacibaculum pelagium]MBA6156285.1 oligosaccharide flippase family protein [Tenacibaculum pelagium]